MSNERIWFITGAGRGMGVDFAKAALEAGHAVVAGADAIATAKQVVADLEADIHSERELSSPLAFS